MIKHINIVFYWNYNDRVFLKKLYGFDINYKFYGVAFNIDEPSIDNRTKDVKEWFDNIHKKD